MQRGKKIIYRVTAFFICAVIALVFFSNTIYTFGLANVSIGFPEKNNFVTYTVSGLGYVELLDKRSYFTDMAGMVELSVKEGEFCREGQLLFRVVPESEDVSNEIKRLENEYAALDFRIEKTVKDIAYYKTKIEEAEIDIPAAAPLDLSGYDAQLDTLTFRINNLNKELEEIKVFHELGIATQSQLNDKENEIKALELQYDQIITQRKNAASGYERAQEQNAINAQKQLDAQLESYNKSVTDLEYQLKALQIDRDNLNMRMEEINMPDSEAFKVYAKEDCVIETFYTEYGATSRKSDKILSSGVINERCRVWLKMSDDTADFPQGTYVDINVRTRVSQYQNQETTITGSVKSSKHEGGDLYIEVVFPAVFIPPDPNYNLRSILKGAIIYGGERASMKTEYASGQMESVVPITAVNWDSGGSFIYTVTRQKSAFGFDYVVQKKYVNVIVSSRQYAALSPIGFEFKDPAIFNADRALHEGDRVRLADGADFIETR